MPKSFKSFTKEYALGLQVPATSYLKPTMSMNLQANKKVVDAPKHMPKKSAGKLDVTEPTRKGSALAKSKKVDSKPKDGITRTTPSTKYKGLAFTHDVPNYTKA